MRNKSVKERQIIYKLEKKIRKILKFKEKGKKEMNLEERVE